MKSRLLLECVLQILLFCVASESVTGSTQTVTGTTPSAVVDVNVTSTPTTVPESTTPTLNTSTALTEFWVITVIKVRQHVNTSLETFRQELEYKLSLVYEEAFRRQEQINNGTYNPLRRRKRYAVSPSGDIKLQVLNVSREADSNNVHLTYLMEKSGSLVPAATAVERMKLIDDQEAALGLGYVVLTKAEPYVKPADTGPVDQKLWIIGAVLGSIAFLLLIWLLVCILCRCCCQKGRGKSVEPHLVKIVRDGEEEHYGEPTSHPECAEESNKESGFMRTSPKKMAYEVNPEHGQQSMADHDEDKKTPDVVMETPNNKRNTGPPNESGSETGQLMYVSEDAQNSDGITPVKKLRRKKPRRANGVQLPVQEQQLISHEEMALTSKPHPAPRHNPPLSQADLSTTYEEEEELLEKAEMERIQNKQRLREQKKRDRHKSSPTKEKFTASQDSQREIDDVLGAPDHTGNTPVPEVFVHKKRNTRRRNKATEGQSNNGFEEDTGESPQSTESLEEARQKMHRLLDDAFSLLSSSRSSIRNKVTPASSPRETPHKKKGKRSKDVEMEEGLQTTSPVPAAEPHIEEKRHTPIFLNPTYSTSHSSQPILEAWSPYRASDEVALISLPSKQTDLKTTPTQEPIATTTFNESYPTSLRDNYYTTEPAKPIFIRTADLESGPDVKSPPHSKHTQYSGLGSSGKSSILKSPGLPNGDVTVYPGMQQFEDIPLNSLSARSTHRDDDGHEKLASSNGGVVEPHRPPAKDWGRDDEIDVVTQSLKPGVAPTPLIRSLREELEHLSGKLHVYDSNVNV
ncbi:uncharacterized protein LOC121381047 isoform X2 [Gigantopelta aegis]|uniref:uncharacterized protein LOC121381047 isoform X2 n=1 Tax=Gigantopelta aegis TaxID=1735272 RepID=UPI001B887CE2|nr:uncharacterized protein LOC121381047 isoform X2 [Gigantopelta aegis]